MVIANRLRDGLTVFLGEGQAWVESIAAGLVARSDDEAAALLDAARGASTRNLVVNPYLISVSGDDARRRPLEWREAIRASGPTVAADGFG